MPWYKFSVTHGPGHQGKAVAYRWFNTILKTHDERKEAWQEWCDPYWEWPIGRVRLVRRIPQQEHDRLVDQYKRRIEAGNEMLRILSETETYVQRVKKYRRIKPKTP